MVATVALVALVVLVVMWWRWWSCGGDDGNDGAGGECGDGGAGDDGGDGGYGGYGGYGGDDDGVLSTEDFGFHFPILENPSLGSFRGAAQFIFLVHFIACGTPSLGGALKK